DSDGTADGDRHARAWRGEIRAARLRQPRGPQPRAGTGHGGADREDTAIVPPGRRLAASGSGKWTISGQGRMRIRPRTPPPSRARWASAASERWKVAPILPRRRPVANIPLIACAASARSAAEALLIAKPSTLASRV